MTTSTSRQLSGHGLWDEGRVYEYGHLRNGVGPARCQCGAKSPDLPSTAQRKQWHREHKAQVSRG